MGNEISQNVQYGETIQNNICIKWEKEEIQNTFPAREGQCCCGLDKTFYVFGGVFHSKDDTDPVESNDLLAFDTDKKKWREVKAGGKIPSPRINGSLVGVGKKLYLFGGLSHTEGWFDVLYEYDIETEKWSKVPVEGKAPSPRDKLAAVSVGTHIYYFGGFGPKNSEEDLDDLQSDEEDELPDGGASFGWFNDMFVFDTVNKKWSQPMQLNLGVPTPRAAHGMCAVGKNVVIFGGRDTNCRRNDLHIFDTETRKWKNITVSGRQPEPRSFHTTTAVGNLVVVMGGRGENNQHFADVHIFNTDTMEWLQPKVTGDLPTGRGQHSVGMVDNKLVLFGGTSDFNSETMQCHTFYNDTYLLNCDDFLQGKPSGSTH